MKLMIRTRRGYYTTECDTFRGDTVAFGTSLGDQMTSEFDPAEIIGVDVLTDQVVEGRHVDEAAPALTSGAIPTVATVDVDDIIAGLAPQDVAQTVTLAGPGAGEAFADSVGTALRRDSADDRGSWSLKHTLVSAAASLALVLGAGVVGAVSSTPAETQAGPKCTSWIEYRGASTIRNVTRCPLVKGGSFTSYGPWVTLPRPYVW